MPSAPALIIPLFFMLVTGFINVTLLISFTERSEPEAGGQGEGWAGRKTGQDQRIQVRVHATHGCFCFILTPGREIFMRKWMVIFLFSSGTKLVKG